MCFSLMHASVRAELISLLNFQVYFIILKRKEGPKREVSIQLFLKFFSVVINIITKRNLGRKGFILCYIFQVTVHH